MTIACTVGATDSKTYVGQESIVTRARSFQVGLDQYFSVAVFHLDGLVLFSGCPLLFPCAAWPFVAFCFDPPGADSLQRRFLGLSTGFFSMFDMFGCPVLAVSLCKFHPVSFSQQRRLLTLLAFQLEVSYAKNNDYATRPCTDVCSGFKTVSVRARLRFLKY